VVELEVREHDSFLHRCIHLLELSKGTFNISAFHWILPQTINKYGNQWCICMLKDYEKDDIHSNNKKGWMDGWIEK
jgi:hypothetical protein